jgi:hypothetical protein
LQKDEKIKEIQQEVANVTNPSWSTKWVGLSFIVEHLEVLPAIMMTKVKKEIGQQILDNKITITIGQLLKLTLNLNIYLTSANKQYAMGEGGISESTLLSLQQL